MLYDTIINLEDFERIIKEKKIDPKNLRIIKEEKTLNEMVVGVSIILTIPSFKHIILRHFIGKKIFNKYFYRDQNLKEYKDYKKFCEDCIKKASEKFGEITNGYWGDE